MKTLFASLLLVMGCRQPAPVGVGGMVEVQRDSTQQCASMCSQIGLPLDSVVIMASNVGCVCRAVAPVGPPAATPPSQPAASAGGMAAIMIAHQAEMERQRQAAALQQQQQQQYKPKY